MSNAEQELEITRGRFVELFVGAITRLSGAEDLPL